MVTPNSRLPEIKSSPAQGGDLVEQSPIATELFRRVGILQRLVVDPRTTQLGKTSTKEQTRIARILTGKNDGWNL